MELQRRKNITGLVNNEIEEECSDHPWSSRGRGRGKRPLTTEGLRKAKDANTRFTVLESMTKFDDRKAVSSIPRLNDVAINGKDGRTCNIFEYSERRFRSNGEREGSVVFSEGETSMSSEVTTIEESENGGRLQENMELQAKGKGRKFWVESKKLEVPPVSHDSNEVLDGPDWTFYGPQFYECNEDFTTTRTITDNIVFPKKIFKEEEGRFFLANLGMVGLPAGQEIGCRLLYVDKNDILYFRINQPDQKPEEHKIDTLRKLLFCLKKFYSDFNNQLHYCVGSNGWAPHIGEVVVVKVNRLMGTELSPTGYFSKVEFQRAIVIGFKHDGITVELLDDYGIGGVRRHAVFRLMEAYSRFPVQMFVCELAEIGIVNFRKIVHTILHECPIHNIWSDCNMNYAGITWRGEVSPDKRPLVEVLIQLKASPAGLKYISLKTHVYQNLQNVLTPFVHLIENTTTCCDIIDANKMGILWVKFLNDEEIRSRMTYVLERLIPHYFNMLDYLHLTVNMMLPKDQPDRLKRNKAKIYVAALPLAKNAEKKALHRVKIVKADCRTNEVKVYSIDHHSYHDIYSWELVPLNNLYPDLSYIAPLVFKVHLHNIKEINVEDDNVKDLLFGQKIKMKLIREWPNNIFPPDVAIDSVDSPDVDNVPFSSNVTGYSSAFISNGWASAFDEGDTEALVGLIEIDAAKRKVENRKDKKLLFYDDKDHERLELLLGHTFMGENYRFMWDNHRLRRNTCASTSSVV